MSPATPLTITAPGNMRLAVLDQRAVPAPFTGDTVTVVAQPPWLRLSSPTYGPALTVGVGQRLDADIARPGNVVAAAAAVGVTRRGSRTASASSGLLPAGAAAALYPIEGRAIGSDTLILAASGYAPDTVEVTVTDGSVEALNWPGLVRAGDSVPILLRASDATRIPHRVTARTTFTMQTTGGLTFSDGGQTISAISIAADSATTPVFYVKGTAAGAASVWFVNVDYQPHTYQTTVVARAIASSQRVR